VPAGFGAMAVILGLDDAAVAAVCAEAAAGEVVSPVNFNSPGQVVIAGHTGAVERAVAAAKVAGAKRAVTLAVSVPAHCALMEPAAQAFAEHLAAIEIRQPDIPVLQNVDAAAHGDPDMIRANLDKHLYSPVQWMKTIQAMRAQGVNRIVEAGPGKVLAGLCKRIDKGISAVAVYDPATLDDALANNQ
jgi:[acyl-carrier-protein] S-malonyltransferase